MNLIENIKSKIRRMGEVEAAKFFVHPRKKKPVTTVTVRNWLDGHTEPPAWAAQLVLEYGQNSVISPPPLDPNAKITVAIPSLKFTNPHTAFCWIALAKKHGKLLNWDMVPASMVVEARNKLATRFMKTNSEWLLMLDDDMVFPIGYGGVYNGRWQANVEDAFASMDIVERLMSHKKELIGGLYFGRHKTGPAQYCEAFNDKGEDAYAHAGPYDKIKETGWVATGAMLIRRSVFEKIEKKFPEVVVNRESIGNGYFTPLKVGMGEDVAFNIRAREAGVQPHVDMGCICGHIGSEVFWAHNTNG